MVLITYGVNTLTATALAAVDRPSVMHRILSLTVLQNIAMNLVLIPPYGATGAALTAAVSGLLLGTLSMWQATRTLGHVRLRRIFIGPAVVRGPWASPLSRWTSDWYPDSCSVVSPTWQLC